MSAAYQPSLIKRHRSTKAEVERRRAALYAIVREMKPMSVRQVYYQAVVHGIVDKTEADYDKVQTDLVFMRRAGEMPYGWLTDGTRLQRKLKSYRNIEEALAHTAEFYRRAAWADVAAYAEVWLEKDALSGVVFPITAHFDVPLMVARGYASLSFLHSAAEHINELTVPAYIYHFGDFDPSGVNAGEKIEQTLREMAPAAEIHFERLAVTEAQVAAWALPTRPTKKTDSRSKGFGDVSVELDAIDPDTLRGIVYAALERHIPEQQLVALKAAEESERQALAMFAREARA